MKKKKKKKKKNNPNEPKEGLHPSRCPRVLAKGGAFARCLRKTASRHFRRSGRRRVTQSAVRRIFKKEEDRSVAEKKCMNWK